MGNFQGGGNRGGGFRGGNSGGRPSFGGNRGGDRREVSMHKAICDECHKSCEVPFRPSGDKPIYCNDCFSSKREGEDRGPRRDFGDRGPKRDFGSNPSAPSFAKPMGGQDDMKKQLGEISTKLDRLVSAIEKLTGPKEVVKTAPSALAKVEVKKTTVAKVAAVKKVQAKAPAKKIVAKKVVSKKK